MVYLVGLGSRYHSALGTLGEEVSRSEEEVSTAGGGRWCRQSVVFELM